MAFLTIAEDGVFTALVENLVLANSANEHEYAWQSSSMGIGNPIEPDAKYRDAPC